MASFDAKLEIKIEDILNDAGLVAVLLARNELLDAPTRTEYFTKHYEIIIGIDNDHTATLTISEDSLNALKEKIDGNYNSR